MANPQKSSRWWLGLTSLFTLLLTVWWLARPAKTLTQEKPVEAAAAKLVISTDRTSAPLTAAETKPAVSSNNATPTGGGATISVKFAQDTAHNQPRVIPADDSAASAPAVSTTPNPEIEASARMYAAHASLRAPEVADPDSASNKAILNTMVMKLIEQSQRNAAPVVGPTKS